MNTLLESLYSILSFIMEDAPTNKIPGFRSLPAPLLSAMGCLMDELEKHLHE